MTEDGYLPYVGCQFAIDSAVVLVKSNNRAGGFQEGLLFRGERKSTTNSERAAEFWGWLLFGAGTSFFFVWRLNVVSFD